MTRTKNDFNMEKDKKFIPVCEPYLKENELKYVTDAVSTGWISGTGGYIKRFEEGFANFCGLKHAIATTSGTTAIHLALAALGIKQGDEIIVPDFTMIGGVFPICYTGAKPVFVDVDSKTWNINPDKIKEKITNKTKAIMVVHVYGMPCDMDPILKIAKENNLYLIEDAAEAHGAEYNGKKVGSFGDVSCFSFYANKIITTGEGGMVVTNNDKIAEKCRYHKNLCFPLDGSRNYFHEDIGFNYRMSNVIAAIGLAQLEKINDYIGMRRKNNEMYRLFLKDVKGITFQDEKDGYKNVYWMNSILIDPQEFGANRNEVEGKLLKKGVETRRFFIGMHKQESLRKYGCDCNGRYNVTEVLSDNGLYLPSGSGLNVEEIRSICDSIKEIFLEKNSLRKNYSGEVTKILPAYEDDRGKIIDIVDGEEFVHAGIVTFKPGAIRGNHYHKKTEQVNYILKGKVRYLSKDLSKKGSKVKELTLVQGDMTVNPPLEWHAQEAIEESEMLFFTKKMRGGGEYEDDVFRVPKEIIENFELP